MRRSIRAKQETERDTGNLWYKSPVKQFYLVVEINDHNREAVNEIKWSFSRWIVDRMGSEWKEKITWIQHEQLAGRRAVAKIPVRDGAECAVMKKHYMDWKKQIGRAS